MSPIAVALLVFACVFGGALAGRALRSLLPAHHLKDETRDILKLAVGLIATLAAMVLGLLVSAASDTFNGIRAELTQGAAKVLQLDRALARYGPDAAPIRVQLKANYTMTVDLLFSTDPKDRAALDTAEATARSEAIPAAIRALAPRDDPQRDLQSQALALANEVAGLRWLIYVQHQGGLAWQLLVVLTAWLTVNFVAFGLLAPPNGTLLAALFMCALCVAGAVLMILELYHPFDGWVRIPDTALRAAIAHLGQ